MQKLRFSKSARMRCYAAWKGEKEASDPECGAIRRGQTLTSQCYADTPMAEDLNV